MKNLLKISTLLILALTLISSSCGGGGGSDPEPEVVDKIVGKWKISSGTNLPQDFSTFRINITKLTKDSASYVITPQNSVQRFDYNNATTSGTVKLAGVNQTLTSATLLFKHNANSGVSVTPNGTATPITIKNISLTGFTIDWAMPDQDASNPGGNKQNPAYSYTFVKE